MNYRYLTADGTGFAGDVMMLGLAYTSRATTMTFSKRTMDMVAAEIEVKATGNCAFTSFRNEVVAERVQAKKAKASRRRAFLRARRQG